MIKAIFLGSLVGSFSVFCNYLFFLKIFPYQKYMQTEILKGFFIFGYMILEAYLLGLLLNVFVSRPELKMQNENSNYIAYFLIVVISYSVSIVWCVILLGPKRGYYRWKNPFKS